MNKLKLAIQALRTYLGADQRGLKLLDGVQTLANECRTRASGLEEEVGRLRESLTTARQEKAATDTANSALRASLQQRESSLAAAVTRESRLLAELGELQRQLNPPEPEREAAAPASVRRFLRLFREVKRRFKRMPGDAYDGSSLVVEDFVPQHTYAEFADLGRLVTLIAMVGFPVKVSAKTHVKDMPGAVEADVGEFVAWFRNRIKLNDAEDSLYRRTHAPELDSMLKRRA